MLAASIIFGVIGAVCGLAGLWYGWQGLRKADNANKKARKANDIATESNAIARKANEIAERAKKAQEEADRRSHSVQLKLVGGMSGRRRDGGSDVNLVVTLQNDGMADAKDIAMKIKRNGERQWYRSDSVPELKPRDPYNFAFVIEQDFFRENEGGRLLDYRVTYRDLLGDHTKQYRVQMSGEWPGGWSFRLLDECLDGTRVRFANAPEKLAVGVAFIEGEGICT